jgi:hypothetical protein
LCDTHQPRPTVPTIENPLIANDHDLVAGLVIEEPHDFRVSARVYTSAALFELEMDRIFGTTWVYVAHESEVADPGSFITGQILCVAGGAYL